MKETFVLFSVGNGNFAMNIQNVVSIDKLAEISDVPETADFIIGMVTIRGQIIPVVDMTKLLFKRSSSIDEHARYILVENSGTIVAFMVEKTNEILDISMDQVKPMDALSTGTTAFIKGVTMLENRIITLLDTEKLFTTLQRTGLLLEESNEVIIEETYIEKG
ncbi:chemotaxis protein CheW [Bacillus sp. V5-8f]|uniref:chemotaxis protein CheW n=1 Tax=Bacillus sp. V5-8f TaxID=2053044 RepID=UPI000C785088|nr:chemotaxis protein CheW [Bacillus sp. V5-8f]PLT32585.1 hypothetical protein CUU64_18110 [Bacillus sp. V5-8f]